MMLTIWGRTTSSNVQTVMWAVGELDLPHERIDAGDAYGVNDTPEYKTMNPMGKIPVLQDGGLTLFESMACLRYLSARYGDAAFWPPDPAARAPLDVWAEWSKTTFEAAVINLFRTFVRRDPATVTKAERDRLAAACDLPARVLDARIGQGPWLAGDTFTFADIAAGHMLPRYFGLDFARPETPHLSRYFRRLQERPAFSEHVMVTWEPLYYRKDR